MAISDIEPTLCTHIIYSYIGISPNDELKTNDVWDSSGYDKFNKLREKNPKVKTLLGIGISDCEELCEKFSTVTETSEQFSEKLVHFLKQHGFEGLNLIWKDPAQSDEGITTTNEKDYLDLLKILRRRFDREGMLLTAAVAGTPETAKVVYDVPKISKYFDFIGTGPNSPLSQVVSIGIQIKKP